MKILLISPFDTTGYGTAGLHTAVAMHSVGLDVVCRRLYLNNKNTINSDILKELLNKDAQGCNIAITLSLPTHLDYNGEFDKNVGMFCFENNTIPWKWVSSLRAGTDEIWVPNSFMAKGLRKIWQLKNPVRVIPFATDLNRYSRNFQGSGYINKLKQETGKFVFYTIGELVSRKNYESLLKAYFAWFSPNEQVALVIKTSKDGWSPEQCKQTFNELIEHVKGNMKLGKTPEVHVITDYYSQEQIDQLHYEGDNYITTSHGEAFSYPVIDALGFGKCPIVPNSGAFLDYMTNGNGFVVDGVFEPCYGAKDTLDELSDGYQQWFSININKLGEAMKDAYTNRNGCITRKKKVCLKSIEKFSYAVVGEQIKKALNVPSKEAQISQTR
jgi:glycosyltransferase involved in cell wall biosynthesis